MKGWQEKYRFWVFLFLGIVALLAPLLLATL
jgi:hypothetical protein